MATNVPLDNQHAVLQDEIQRRMRLPCRLYLLKRHEAAWITARLEVRLPDGDVWTHVADGTTAAHAAQKVSDKAFREIHLCVEDVA